MKKEILTIKCKTIEEAEQALKRNIKANPQTVWWREGTKVKFESTNWSKTDEIND